VGAWRYRCASDLLSTTSTQDAGAADAAVALLYAPGPLRVTDGPQAEEFASEVRTLLTTSTWHVLEQSDRMGIRLQGPRLERRRTGDLLTEGVSLGAIQVPPAGQPIVLFVDHQTTGGYPKIANVVTADLHRLGQLRPRDAVRFESVSFETAAALLQRREAALAAIAVRRGAC
jgi:antagonist of KipI